MNNSKRRRGEEKKLSAGYAETDIDEEDEDEEEGSK